MLFTFTWTSDRLNKRGLIAFLAPILVLIGYILVIVTPNPKVGFFAMFLCGGGTCSILFPFLTPHQNEN